MWRRLAILDVLAAALCAGRYRAGQQISIGSILLASDKLSDPNFTESVILILQYDPDEGTVGIVINRRSDLTISKIFPKMKRAAEDLVYMGGPVGLTAVQALLRSPEKADQATHVVGDVYVTGAKEVIEKSIAARADPSKFRLYVGYAGWAPGQLEGEIRLGAWSVLSRGPKVVFDENPDSLWERLTRESHLQMAQIFVKPG